MSFGVYRPCKKQAAAAFFTFLCRNPQLAIVALAVGQRRFVGVAQGFAFLDVGRIHTGEVAARIGLGSLCLDGLRFFGRCAMGERQATAGESGGGKATSQKGPSV